MITKEEALKVLEKIETEEREIMEVYLSPSGHTERTMNVDFGLELEEELLILRKYIESTGI